eukprot:TRINITY_DN11078_c0_g1_i1.p1 TRINITY_DN11078_c0_g1~~TRINITY_DN11078_c0_g1_i1.p1  ORF type:complete len:218 (+),score=76.72 TRINITY_DN11078_c0_g1_i1:80-655(+)
MAADGKNFEFDWDSDGIITWVAGDYGRGAWRNPHATNAVAVTASSVASGRLAEFVDKEFQTGKGGQSLQTEDQKYSWLQVELPVAVSPTHYRLSHPESSRDFLCNWAFCGSFDGENWLVLASHTQDKTLNDQELPDSLTGAWEAQPPRGEFYPYFRLVLTGPNSAGRWAMAGCCLELFGVVRHRMWPEGTQ